nr:hypothetical protein CFP56_41393 [Quercus suber]
MSSGKTSPSPEIPPNGKLQETGRDLFVSYHSPPVDLSDYSYPNHRDHSLTGIIAFSVCSLPGGCVASQLISGCRRIKRRKPPGRKAIDMKRQGSTKQWSEIRLHIRSNEAQHEVPLRALIVTMVCIFALSNSFTLRRDNAEVYARVFREAEMNRYDSIKLMLAPRWSPRPPCIRTFVWVASVHLCGSRPDHSTQMPRGLCIDGMDSSEIRRYHSPLPQLLDVSLFNLANKRLLTCRQSLATIWLYMVAELSALQQVVSLLTGLNGLPAVIVECAVTTAYTAAGGFRVSFVTDNIQGGWSILQLNTKSLIAN